MRARLAYALALVLALALAGCSVKSGALGPLAPDGQASSPPSAAAAAESTPSALASPTSTVTATPSPAAAASPTAAASRTMTSSSDATSAAIQAVIQRANDEQQQAFAQQNPSIMRDTATSDYYDQLVQINQHLASGGVASIELVKIEWGPITLDSPSTAHATTYETWQTTYTDGSVDRSRERNVYTLVQEQGAWKIQSDDHPDAAGDQAPGVATPTPSGPATPGPSPSVVPPPIRVLPGQRDVSNNWSGYAATGGTFTGVTGTWTVPEPETSGVMASSATWVGIGGANSRDLIQAGTEETSDGSGLVHYDAWIETLPQPSHPVQFTVRPGDSVTVSIAQRAAGEWQISFRNNTTGQSYQTTVQYTSSLSSAEWIQEAPSGRRQVLPLDSFGTIKFSGGSAFKDGKSVTISEAGAKPITMVDVQGNVLATPSALTADGSGFSVTRSDQAPVAQPRPGRNGLPSRSGGSPSRARDAVP